MMSWFYQLWYYIRRALGLVVPFFAKAGDWPKWKPVLFWTIRIIVLLIWEVGLYLLNRYVFPWISLSALNWLLEETYLYLPAAGLLFVIFCWAAYWLWMLIARDQEISEFPDIDDAWREAVRALNRIGTDVRDYPLFLVLGKPQKPEELLFNGASLQFAVRQAPAGDAPLHLYAFHEGKYDSIFVTCAGASILGEHSAILRGEKVMLGGSRDGNGATAPINVTAAPTAAGQEILDIYRRAHREGREVTPEEKRQLEELAHRGAGQTSLLQNDEELRLARARLQHLCRLIVRDRRPYCPLNGIVMLLPWHATRSDQDAKETAQLCQHELAALAESLRVHCPLWVVICDIAVERGFAEAIARFPREVLKDRVGSRFPMRADVDPDRLPEKVDKLGSWIMQTYLPNWIYRFLSLNPAAAGKIQDETRQNGELVRLLCACRTREKRFGMLLKESLFSNAKSNFYFSGCYTIALGETLGVDQAFIPGLIRRVIDTERFVSWTRESASEDTAYGFWTKVGYAVIGALVVAAVALVIYKLTHS
jgi:hypothetical protein